jgi:hypothetical protein
VLIAFCLLARSRLETAGPISRGRVVLAGLSLGLAVLVEYTAGLAAGCVALYAALTLDDRRRLGWIAVFAVAALGLRFGGRTAAAAGRLLLGLAAAGIAYSVLHDAGGHVGQARGAARRTSSLSPRVVTKRSTRRPRYPRRPTEAVGAHVGQPRDSTARQV